MSRLCSIVALFLSLAGVLLCQTNTGQITGQVFDAQKAPVGGAQVEVTNLATNYTMKLVTSDAGIFVAPSLQPATYRVTVTRSGFQKAVLESVEVLTGRGASVDIDLKVGQVNESIVVDAKAPLLSTEDAMVAATVESTLIENLPQTERSVLGVILLVPGVTSEPGGVGSETPGAYTGFVQPNAGTSIGGGQPGGSSVLVDGSDNSAITLPRPAITFSRDTVQEITVMVNGVPAQYGRSAGGVINQTTRSGANTVHGNAGWNHTDPAFLARPFNSPTPSQRHMNLFNGAISGPVVIPKLYNGRNRTFFLFNYEPSRQQDSSWATATVPNPYELKGDFNYSWQLIDQNVVRAQGMNAAMAKGPIYGIYYQTPINADGFPIGVPYSNVSQYVPIPNNNLSAQLAKNKFAQNLISLFPTPTNPGPYTVFTRPDGLYDSNGQNAFILRSVKNTDDRYTTKIDHQLGDRDRVSGRYSLVPNRGVRASYFGPDSPLNPIPQDNIVSRNATLSETHLIGSSMVNEFRLTYTRMNSFRGQAPIQLSRDWTSDYGMPPATKGVGAPNISLRNIQAANVGPNSNDGKNIDANFGLGDDFSIVRGRHAIKFGADIRRFQQNKYSDNGLYGGSLSFSDQSTYNGANGGNSMATLILGMVSSYTFKSVQIPFYYRWQYYAGYVQDSFKVTRKLTVNYGVRYQLETPRSEKFDRQGSFLPGLAGTVNGAPVTGGFAFSGTNGLGHSLWPAKHNSFEPRVGLAWNPKPKLTVRASYAMLHAPLTNLGLGTNTVAPDLGSPNQSIGGTNGGVTSGMVVDLITNPIATPLPAPTLITNAPVFNGSSVTLIHVDQSTAVPYIQQWSYTMQHQLLKNSLIETGYMGTRGTHLFLPQFNLNTPTVETVLPYIQSQANFSQTVNNPMGLKATNGSIMTTNLFGSLRPYQNFYNQGIPEMFDRRGNSIYHAWYVAVRQRFAAGITLMASYTVSKSIDDATSASVSATWFGGAAAQDPYNLRPERSISVADVPQRVVTAFSYELPVGSGSGKLFNPRNRFVKAAIANWRLSGNFSSQAGQPFRVQLNGTGYYMSLGGGDAIDTGAVTLRPDVVPCSGFINPNWHGDPLYATYVNPACFAVPGSLNNPKEGNAGRVLPYIRSPWLVQADAALGKDFKIRERLSVQLRGEFMNVFNHTNFGLNPNAGHQFLTGSYNRATPATPFAVQANFGKLQTANGTRLIKGDITIRF